MEKISKKNNRKILIVSVIIITLMLLILAIYSLVEYRSFKSDYEAYIKSITRLNELYVKDTASFDEMSDMNVIYAEYENIKHFESKYEDSKFTSLYQNIQEESAVVFADIEEKRKEKKREKEIDEERKRLEQERLEKEREEAERIEHERQELAKKESEREEKLKQEQERLEQERLEQERLEQERLEQERLEQERLEQERRESERFERERFQNNNNQIKEEPKVTRGVINGHEYVDLGLSVKWATCNVGAAKPEAYGDYFAWGETESKYKYTERNFKTRMTNVEDYSSDSIYDVATKRWESTWRMPKMEEFEELTKKCYWKWMTKNGVNGYEVTGPNGNSIFLPAGGDYDGGKKYYEEDCGYYWSSTSYTLLPFYAYDLYFDVNGRHVGWTSRYLGKNIRPVSD